MRWLILLFLGLWPLSGLAQTVTVQSGEHARFSRLVVTFPSAVDWRMQRVTDGYLLTSDKTGLRYDLSQVYALIPRDRLATIFADPDGAGLHLGIGCACHAQPFELRPGTVVIDILDGPAPEGSAFEEMADGTPPPPLGSRDQPRPRQRPATAATEVPETPAMAVDWAQAARAAARLPEGGRIAATPMPVGAVDPTDPAAAALREQLIWQLSRGAAEGAVEMVEKPTEQPAPTRSAGQVRINGETGVSVELEPRMPGTVTGEGRDCIAPDRLAIADWGQEGAVADTLAGVRSGLVGEFDRPDPSAIERAVKTYLFLGFGSEARQVLQAMRYQGDDTALWESLAHILDGDPVPGKVFNGMESCAGPAALWAVLAQPEAAPPLPLSGDGLQALSALPLHLRELLGPTLVRRSLALGDTGMANAIEASILRATDEPGDAMRLAASRIDRAEGDHPAADAALAPLTVAPGETGIEATVALIEATVAQGLPVPAEHLMAAAAFLKEHAGGPQEQALRNALALSHGSQGNFTEAFALVADDATRATLWQVLAEHGPDSALIDHALGTDPLTLPHLPPQVERHLSERLTGLGFGRAALNWLQPARRSAGLEVTDRVLRAAAYLQARDGQRVLEALAGLDTDEAALLRAQAQALLGQSGAAESFAAAGSAEQGAVTARRLQDWQTLRALTPEADWSQAAALLDAPTEADAGPLARGRSVVEESEASRAVLDRLLSTLRADAPSN